MSPQNVPFLFRLFGFPRVSGDEPGAGVQVVIPNAFSPCERG